jgi:ABC-2 type transport system permease protein
MRWRRVRAVVRRDLVVALGAKAGVLPAVIVPFVLFVLLPAGIAFGTLRAEATAPEDLQALLDALPAAAVDQLSDDPAVLTAQLLLAHVLAPLVMIIPVMVSAVIAADGIAGEKERRTLEALLLTPLSDRELAFAKLAAALVPAVVLGLGGAVMYAAVVNLSLAGRMEGWLLPTSEYAVMALVTGPAFAALALAGVSLISVRVRSTQEAFQLGGIVVLPVVGLLVAQVGGLLLLSVPALLVTAAIALALAAGLVAVSARSMTRPRLGERLG